MQTGRSAKISKITRKLSDAAREGQEGLLVRRLNVAWEKDIGALWTVRFADGVESAFAESELQQIEPDGRLSGHATDTLVDTWGVAPRVGWTPKSGEYGKATSRGALASVLFLAAGLMLVIAGLSNGQLPIAFAGAAFGFVGSALLARLVTRRAPSEREASKGPMNTTNVNTTNGPS